MSNTLGNFVLALAAGTLEEANRKIERLLKERDDARSELAKLRAQVASNTATAAPGDLPPLPEPLKEVDVWVADTVKRNGMKENKTVEPDGDYVTLDQCREYGRACIASNAGAAPALTVWEGSMPESNGKSNFTAILMRKGGKVWDGITIDRSEYPDRVRYEADRVRYLIGELVERPCITDYDADKHSGYAAPSTSPAGAKEKER